ncbi:MAG: universal stress protein [Bacteroidota bacterium]
MENSKKIVVPFDADDRSLKALTYAAKLATGLGAHIIALHVFDADQFGSKAQFQTEFDHLINKRLKPLLMRIGEAYPKVKKIQLQTLGKTHSLPRHIIEFAATHQIDFIVMRSHGLADMNDWERHFRTINAYQVVLEAQCPVFTFTETSTHPQLKHILVPIDLSDGSLFKVPLAVSLAQKFGACLHLLSASEYKEDHEELQEKLDNVRGQIANEGVRLKSNPIFVGTLREAVQSYAKSTEIDLVTIMSRPGFRWSDIWVSPKAKRIISRSRVPVLSLRSKQPFDPAI